MVQRLLKFSAWGRVWIGVLLVQTSLVPLAAANPDPLILFRLPTELQEPDPPVAPAETTVPLRIEIHLRQRQAILYRGNTRLKSYPVAVGRQGWETPQGTFAVKQMIRNPTWIHPLTGAVIRAGDPENPLGRYWIGFWTNGKNWIGFHGTPNPNSVGKAASHGCIRMFNQHIEELFGQVQVGTPVIVKQ